MVFRIQSSSMRRQSPGERWRKLDEIGAFCWNGLMSSDCRSRTSIAAPSDCLSAGYVVPDDGLIQFVTICLRELPFEIADEAGRDCGVMGYRVP